MAAPKEVTLTFAAEVALTSAKLESPDGSKVALKPLPEGNVKEARVPLPTLAAGSYRLLWRATSDDGHVMHGEISFVVSASAPQ
jgi:methionine-rich copper-binding protein CopC